MGARATWMAIATCLSCLAATESAGALGLLQAATSGARVQSHRMALAVSADRTVLWDELTVAGTATDFLWLLPVRPGSTFEVANPAWFDTLDAVTRARVGTPRAECVQVDTGGGCGCAEPQPEPYTPYDNGVHEPTSVQVIRSNTVGPYRTNLVSSLEPGALAAYIAEGGYVVPDGFESTIQSYISEGYDFLAVSLRPSMGVTDMKPIRVVTPGGAPVLPLRMLAVGAAPVVPVDLYVIAEGRQSMPELTEVFLKPGALTWDADTDGSNYEAVESAALAQNDGMSVFTAFASGNPFAMRHSDDRGDVRFAISGGSTFFNLADLYFAQGRLEAASAAPACPSIVAALQSDLQVAEVAGQGQLDDALFACGPMLDLQQALIGQRPARTWLTRLDLELRTDRLGQDYVVAPQSNDVAVIPNHSPERLINAPANCHEPIFRSSVAPRPVRRFGWATVPLVLLAAVLRRRFRRARGAA
jgi:hypothetical protein